jgi:predicted nucleotide-binding protein
MDEIILPIHRNIKYLYALLKRYNIERFFLTREFKIVLMELNADELWEAIYRHVISKSSIAILVPNYTGYVDETFLLFINFLYLNYKDFLLALLDYIILEFLKTQSVEDFNFLELRKRLLSSEFEEFRVDRMEITKLFSKSEKENKKSLEIQKDLHEKAKPLKLSKDAKEEIKIVNTKRVFVVHGRFERIREDMFSFLRIIGLEPIEWEEAIRFTGKGAPFIGEILEKAFNEAQVILVLLTPDDKVKLRQELYKKGESREEREFRHQARPNVLFEAGMAFGNIPNRTILVQIGDVKKFSDVAGRHIIKFDGSEKSRMDLISRLKTAGCNVNIEGVNKWRETGDFNLL